MQHEVNGRIDHLALQRNRNADEAVILAGQLAAAQARIAEMEKDKPQPVPQGMYAAMAKCLHEYQLSTKQEARLFADPAFMAWYTQQTSEGQGK